MAATLSVFFSYVDLDAGPATQIKLIFGTLRNDFRIELTAQRPLPNDSGEDPNLAALRECDLAVVLMSKAYVRSEYMRRRILPAVVSRMEAGDCYVLPIYLEATGPTISPLVGKPIANVPSRPLNTYTDPKQGYLILEKTLRKFLEREGFSRFATAGTSWLTVMGLALLGLLIFAGWVYWRETSATAPPPAVAVDTSATDPLMIATIDRGPSTTSTPGSKETDAEPCIPPAIFSDSTSCTILLPTSGNYRGCKYQHIFYVLTPECDTLRLPLSTEQHRRIFRVSPFSNGRATVYWRDRGQEKVYPAFLINTRGQIVERL